MVQRDRLAGARQTLSALPFFSSLDPATQEAVARAAVRVHYDTDQIVFYEDEPSTGLYVVEAGWLKAVKVSSAGRELILRIVGPSEVFNDLSAWVDTPHLATVIALEPATIWIIPREALLQILETHPGLAPAVITSLAERVRHLVALVQDLSLRSVEGRLAHLLLTESIAGVLRRQRWTTQAELAARLGTVPDVLNRALRNLVDAGLIRVERHQIVILDHQGLEARATAV